MQARTIILKLIVFICIFSGIFFFVRSQSIFQYASKDMGAIPWLFSAISLIFSIISGFVIQSKWQTWNELIDSSRGELSSFRQLYIMAHHFPDDIEARVRSQIAKYLELVVEEDNYLDLGTRTTTVDNALFQLEDTIFNARAKHPGIADRALGILARCMNYREKRLQNNDHKLPLGVRIFVISATIAVVFSSFFIVVETVVFAYVLTLVIGILSYGIYLLIDDLDHPYRPGDWHLHAGGYKELLKDLTKISD